MMWSTFIVKRFSAAAYLMEKVSHDHAFNISIYLSVVCCPNIQLYGYTFSQVGKAPKDRLCRRVSLSFTWSNMI